MIEDLLIGGGVKRSFHLRRAKIQLLAARVIKSGIETHVHFLVPAGILCAQSLGIDQEQHLYLASTRGPGLCAERDLSSRRVDCKSGSNILIVVMILRFSGLNRKITLAVADLNVTLVHF